MSAAEPLPEAWRARLELGFSERAGKTLLIHRRRLGPLAVQRPFYPEGGLCHVYLLHPPGGVVGGDQLDIDVRVDSGQALITTPGATKFYRSAGPQARQQQSLHIADGASLEWLPQENIFFPGAQASVDTRITLDGSARIAAWEIQCLGRPANRERFDTGALDLRLSLCRDDQALLLERLRIDAQALERSAILGDLPVTGNLIISGMDCKQRDAVRALLPDECFAATLIEDVLIIRYLGASTETARVVFTRCWSQLRPQQLNRTANRPRIWAT